MSELDHALAALARQTYRAALSGELQDAAQLLERLAEQPLATARAWHTAISTAAWMLSPDAFSKPSAAELESFVGDDPEARGIASLALTHLERACAVNLEQTELEQLVRLHEKLLAGVRRDEGDELGLWLEAAHAWRALGSGVSSELADRLQLLEKRALSAKVAPLVIDASVQRALVASAGNDVETATALARRAARMARTEALPQQEYLAYLMLARARRSSGHTHLAIRILTALEPIVVRHFEGWLAWELVMAGELEISKAVLGRAGGAGRSTRALDAARALHEVECAALAGDRPSFARSAELLTLRARGSALIEREAASVLAALDFRATIGEDADLLASWCNTEQALPPPELHGLCVRADGDVPDDEDALSEAYVFASPGTAPRRILGLGAKLVDVPGVVRLRRTRRRQGRVEIMAAILAGSEAGIDPLKAFEQAYEIAFEPEVHRGVFEVLLHRVRGYLAPVGELDRIDGGLHLKLRAPVLVPDPRCARPLHDRLLRVLAREGKVSASDAAHKVGLSVRAVQDALKNLIEDGVCASERDGRQIIYVVEDTTFSEPTQRLAFARRGS